MAASGSISKYLQPVGKYLQPVGRFLQPAGAYAPEGSTPEAPLWLLAAALFLPMLYLLTHQKFSLLVAFMVIASLLVAWRINRGLSIVAAFLFLLLLGEIRRIVSTYLGAPGLDPMLLVGTAFATYLALPILLTVRLVDSLSKVVLALTAIMCIEIVNPRQGPLIVGLSGALFYLTPLFWFWIARRYATQRLFLTLIHRVVIPAGIIAACLGLYQTYVGFLPWESAWIKKTLEAGYTALNLGGGHIRSFGFSSNGTEYGNLLMISGVCMVAAIMTGRRVYVLFLPIVLTAQLLASQRTPIIKIFVATALLWAFRANGGKSWIQRLILVGVLAIGGGIYSTSNAGSAGQNNQGTTADYATRHVTQGLSHPFDSRYSTAGIHFQMFKDGVWNGIVHPLGAGLGAVTLGSGKFGGGDSEVSGSSEVDISDAFITMGVIGGCLYLAMIIIGLKFAVEYCQTAPQNVSFPIMGILTCMLLVWVPLGEYALGPLVWFCLGFLAKDVLERRAAAESEPDEEPEEEPVFAGTPEYSI